MDGQLYFHTSPKGDLGGWAGRAACVSLEDTVCWLPSYWRNRQLACPATTYYRSVVGRGTLQRVQGEKARVMQAFMEKYQPEGGYRPLGDAVYRGPLDALTILSLRLEDVSCKAKFGQHLSAAQRRSIIEALVERGAPGDVACAHAMRIHNQDLAEQVRSGWTCDPTMVEASQIWELLAPTYWGHRRTRDGVEEQRDAAWFIVACLEEGRLLAYARVHRVDARTAFLYDVIVAPGERGRGLGKQVMERVLAHPKVAEVERVFLDTRDAMGLYAQFGFRACAVNRAGSTTMVRLAGEV